MVAANADGLLKYDGINWVKYKSGADSLSGPLYKYVSYIKSSPDNSVWVVSQEKIADIWHFAISHFNGSSWIHYTKDGDGNDFILTYKPLAVAPDGSLWIMDINTNRLYRNSILHFDGTTWTRCVKEMATSFSLGDEIVVSEYNIVDFGTDMGVMKIENNVMVKITPDENPMDTILGIKSIKSLTDNTT